MIVIRDREAGNIIIHVLSFEEGNARIKEWEEQDKEDGTYEENFYEVVELESEDISMEERLKVLLNNAISLLADETFEQYDDPNDWKNMIEVELGCTIEELEQYGVYILV